MLDQRAAIFERFAMPSTPTKRARPVGRPKLWTAESLAALLTEHAQMSEWFHSKFGRAPKSDGQLLAAYFANECEKRGMRAGRAQSQDFKGRVKTLRNQLAQARRAASLIPKTAL